MTAQIETVALAFVTSSAFNALSQTNNNSIENSRKRSQMKQQDFFEELSPITPFVRPEGDNRPIVVSLFSGAGGLDMGFVMEGFNIVWANDMDSDACETYKVNIGDHIRCGDIESFMRELEQFKDQVDLLIGGPPCQGFSALLQS